MPASLAERQKRLRLPVSTPMSADDVALVDKAAALRGLSRAEYIRRTVVRDARTALQRAASTAA